MFATHETQGSSFVSRESPETRLPQRAATAVCCALIGAAAGALLILALYGVRPNSTLEMDGAYGLPGVVDGIYDPEFDPAADRTFAWTRQQLRVVLPGVDRARAWDVVVYAAGGRADSSMQPELAVAVDGVVRASVPMTNEFRQVKVQTGREAPGSRGIVISVSSSNTFVPGNGDRRELGVMLDRIELRAAAGGFPLAPPRVVAAGALSGGILAALFACLGLPLWLVATAVGAMSALLAPALLAGFGAYETDPWRVAAVAASVAAAAWLTNWLGQRVKGSALSTASRAAIAMTAAVLFGRLAILLHAMMYVGDSLFHLHRLQWVLAGNYYFTSIGPGGRFPYPIALYLAAEPFASVIRDPVLALRTIVAVSGALAGLAVYWMVIRGWNDRVAAMAALICFLAAPIDFLTQAAATQTNAFGQSLSVIALALLSSPMTALGLAASALALTAAMLSHTSTFAILFVTVLLLGAALWVRRDEPWRRAARRTLVALAIAALAAVVLYYGHFGAVYREQVASIAKPAPPAAVALPEQSPKAHKTEWAPGWLPLKNRVAAVPGYAVRYFGVPLILLALAGIREIRRRELTGVTSVVWATLAACFLFLLLGLFTPIDMRYYLAAHPALAILAGLASSWLWETGKPRRAAVAVVMAWMSVTSAVSWLSWLP